LGTLAEGTPVALEVKQGGKRLKPVNVKAVG